MIKIRLILIVLLRELSDIKLKRTDTTLDLSQKATVAERKVISKCAMTKWRQHLRASKYGGRVGNLQRAKEPKPIFGGRTGGLYMIAGGCWAV